MTTASYFLQLQREALQHGYNLARKNLASAGLTDEDLIWYNQACTVFRTTWLGAILPEGLTGSALTRFKRVRSYLSEKPFPNHPATFATLVYSQCICGTAIIGLEESEQYQLGDHRCLHLENLMLVLGTAVSFDPKPFTAADCGLIDEELRMILDQLYAAGIIYSHQLIQGNPNRYRVTVRADGYTISSIIDHLLGHQDEE